MKRKNKYKIFEEEKKKAGLRKAARGERYLKFFWLCYILEAMKLVYFSLLLIPLGIYIIIGAGVVSFHELIEKAFFSRVEKFGFAACFFFLISPLKFRKNMRENIKKIKESAK